MTIKRALISVCDKSGIVELAQSLVNNNIEILSTGGTAKLLLANNIAVVEVADYTKHPEMMAGRVKTLHPKIHGGILARGVIDDQELAANKINKIDLVVVNLYAFEKTIAKPNTTLADAIENIDIGGPAMLRSSAKNYDRVSVVVDIDDYAMIIEDINTKGDTSLDTRKKLALKVFEHTAKYDGAIASYLGAEEDGFANTINLQLHKSKSMRYGENPHQSASLYIEKNLTMSCVANAKQIQGKQISYNNIVDADCALECVRSFSEPACVIVKHANPCGVAMRSNINKAYLDAFRADSTSAFGGIIAFNRELDADTAKNIIDKQFVEVIVAPSVSSEAKKHLETKRNVRVCEVGNLDEVTKELDYKRISGGLLVQDKDINTEVDINCVSDLKPNTQQMQDLLFAWKVAKQVKSNAIVYAKDKMTIGIGAGQMSRIYSAKIAGIKAADENLQVKGAVMASDAFFPFRDSVDLAAKSGIAAIIQPGGSMRDDEVIQAANELGIIMVFTGIRHFKH